MKAMQQKWDSTVLAGSLTRFVILLFCVLFIGEKTSAQDVIKALPDDPKATDTDRKFIERTYEIAKNAVEHGNHPFGALLVHDGKIIAEFENEVITSEDITKHAETGLIGVASKKLSHVLLTESTLYTSTEPCIMCSGAIYWAGIQKIVFGTSESQMDIQIKAPSTNHRISCEEIFQQINPEMTIIGPVLEEEGLKIHASYWSTVEHQK